MAKLAIVRVRGQVRLSKKVKTTLEYLRLTKKQTVVIVEDTPEIRGMLNKAAQYITWGEVDDETVQALAAKKGIRPVYHLPPPRGGYERKGIKMPYTKGGALGYRGKDVTALLKRMME